MQNKSQQFCFLSQYTWPLSMCIQNLNTLSLIEDEKFVAENLLGEKEKWTNKGNDKQQHDTIQQGIPNICIKFQNPRCSSS